MTLWLFGYKNKMSFWKGKTLENGKELCFASLSLGWNLIIKTKLLEQNFQ